MSAKALLICTVLLNCVIAILTENVCQQNEEYRTKNLCAKKCGGGVICLNQPGCVCKDRYFWDSEELACCKQCKSRGGYAPTSKIMNLCKSVADRLMNVPFVPTKAVRGGIGIVIQVTSYVPKTILHRSEKAANAVITQWEAIIAYSQYQIKLSGRSIQENVNLVYAMVKGVVVENREAIDSIANYVEKTQTQLRDKLVSVFKVCLPSFRAVPSYVKEHHYSKIVKDASNHFKYQASKPR